MKSFLALVAAGLVAGLLVTLACGGDQDAATVELGEESVLAIGESVRVAGESLEIAFVAVTEDSRCARDVTCIWEGRVVAAVEVTLDDETQALDLAQPGLTDSPASTDFQAYRFSFAVEPYPETSAFPIVEGEYRLYLTVTRYP